MFAVVDTLLFYTTFCFKRIIQDEIKGEHHDIVYVLAAANMSVYKPIASDVIIRAGKLQARVKISLSP